MRKKNAAPPHIDILYSHKEQMLQVAAQFILSQAHKGFFVNVSISLIIQFFYTWIHNIILVLLLPKFMEYNLTGFICIYNYGA